MSNIKSAILIGCILSALGASAQKQHLKFHSLNSIGTVSGQSGVKPIIQSVNGFTVKSWFAGIGIGMDFYQYNTFPLFVNAKKYIGKNHFIYFYGEMGYNLVAKNNLIYAYDFNQDSKLYGGLYNDLGIGYKIKLNKMSSFHVAVGYSLKKLSIKTNSGCDIIYPCQGSSSIYKYSNGRMSLKAGIEF